MIDTKEKFEAHIPVPRLPLDYPENAGGDFEGQWVYFKPGQAEDRRLWEAAASETVPVHFFLLAVFRLFIAKISGSEDILVDIPEDGTFRDFLAGVNRQIWEGTFEGEKDNGGDILYSVIFSHCFGALPLGFPPGCDLGLATVEDSDSLFSMLIYNTIVYKEETVVRFARYFKHLVSITSADTGIRRSQIELLPEKDKEELLTAFNKTAADYPRNKTLHGLFTEQAARTPDAAALTGIHKSPHIITYKKLAEITDGLAARLTASGITNESIAAVLTGRSPELVIGILAILKAGGIYLPLDPDGPANLKQYMLADSKSDILLTTKDVWTDNYEGINVLFVEDTPEIKGTESSINSRTETETADEPGIAPQYSPPAYVIYTSGSTGRPKGVMVTHRNVVRLVCNNNYVPLTKDTRVLQTGAPVFDAATFEIWGTLVNGGVLVLPPGEIISQATLLGKALNNHQINTLWLSSPLFNHLVRQDMELLSPILYLLVGGDVLSPAHINMVRNRFPRLTVINGYGPTENTTFSTTFRIDRTYTHHIPIGGPITNSTAYIVDKYGHLQPVGTWGELWVGGEGVSLGYMNRPELTAESYIANPFPRFEGEPPSPRLYRTGDLARRLPDGAIEYGDRMDRQVKIRGFRVEPGEVEERIQSHDSIQEAVVTTQRGRDGDVKMFAYIVPARDRSLSGAELSRELKQHLSRIIPGYMIPSGFILMEQLPFTSSGKIDMQRLPDPADERYTGKRAAAVVGTELERLLIKIWSRILGEDETSIDPDMSFFELGGHSLKAGLLAAEIYKTLHVKISLPQLFAGPTIREMAQQITQAATTRFSPVQAAEKLEYYPLSPAQQRMYVVQQMEPESTVYNILNVTTPEPGLERSTLENIFRRLIERHESFRTSFRVVDGQPVQVIHDMEEISFSQEYYEPQEGAVDAMIHRFRRPFDLTRAPLLRAGLIKTPRANRLLLMDFHHIICDGISLQQFEKEFAALAKGDALEPQVLQYKDYSQWQHQWMQMETSEIKAQETFWLNEFSDGIPELSLPMDFPRPLVRGFEGGEVHFSLGAAETRTLQKAAIIADVTHYIYLLAVFNILVSRLCGSEDIVIGTPTAGRRHPDLQQVIGMFVNTLALRNKPTGEKTFSEFLKEVRHRTLEAFENQDYPFEQLVKQLGVERDADRNPLFDVMFTLRTGIDLAGNVDYSNRIAKFDMTLTGIHSEEEIYFILEYRTQLFRRGTMQRWGNYFKRMVLTAAENPGIRISEIQTLTGEERRLILYDLNDTAAEYPRDKTLHRLFEEQVKLRPDAAAVVDTAGSCSLTYSRLNRDAGKLASVLRSRGVKTEDIIGIMVERSVEMVIGLLGILKAGGTYFPINPNFPQERVASMLADSGSELLVTGILQQEKLTNRQALAVETIRLGDLHFERETDSEERVEQFPETGPHYAAYALFTSGSTGTPKGTLISHSNAVCMVKSMGFMEILPDDRVLNANNYTFDASVFDIFSALLNGAALVLAEERQGTALDKLPGLIMKENISVFLLTTAVFNTLVDVAPEALAGVRKILFGGERASTDHVRRAFEHVGKGRLIQLYGPTETTVFVTYYCIDTLPSMGRPVPIGMPVPNTSIFILDGYMNPVPPGVTGEIFIGGEQLSRGYLNNPEMTMGRFVSNPFEEGERLYGTGDLGRRLPDGNIEFAGRKDMQVKMRGFRIEPGEIENQLLRHRLVEKALVTTRKKGDDDNCLCAYVIVRDGKTADGNTLEQELKAHLGRRLPDYMIPSHIIRVDRFPLTPSGKVDMAQLPEPETPAPSPELTTPTDAVEERLTDIWAEILNVENSQLGSYANFFRIGGHSLNATVMVDRVNRAFTVKIRLAEVFRYRTIQELAARIRAASQEGPDAIETSERRRYYPLSTAQRWVYDQHILHGPGNRVFNMPWMGVLKKPEGLDREKVESIFRQLVERHEGLRTSFHLVKGEPVQRIHKKIPFEVELFEQGTLPRETFMRSFVRPFDITRAPLLRVGLLNAPDGTLWLMLDMHHIISDGESFAVLFREFKTLREGRKLPPLGVRYVDYVLREEGAKRKKDLEKQKQYWSAFFDKGLPVLNLPTDNPVPGSQTVKSAILQFELKNETTAALKQLARLENCTMFMLLLALFNVLLYKLTGAEELVITSYIAGRRHAELQRMVGMFVNTSMLRFFPSGGKSFKSFLEEVRKETLTAYENQEFRLDILEDEFMASQRQRIEGDGNHPPTPRVHFAFQNLNMAESEMASFRSESIKYKEMLSYYDLFFDGYEVGGRLVFNVEYASDVFKEERIKSFIKDYTAIIDAVTADPSGCSSEIAVL